jgi:hypothetical protein
MFSKMMKCVLCAWMLMGIHFSAAFSQDTAAPETTEITAPDAPTAPQPDQKGDGEDDWGAGS